MVIALEHPDILHLQAAQGWLELGNHLEANEELENISPQMRAHPDVLEIRWHIFAKAQIWEACVDIASAIIELAPHHSEGWIQCSFALHELERTQEALDILLPVAEQFSSDWNVPYNLACYCAQLGRFDEAQNWFRRAMAVDEESVEQSAVYDPDLQPLWDSMNGTLWKRARAEMPRT